MQRIRVLGIDPGTQNTGYAFVDQTLKGKEIPSYGLIKTTKADGEVRERIELIGQKMSAIITTYTPDIIAVEDFTEQGKKTGKCYKEMSWLVEHLRMIGKYAGTEVVIYKNAEWKRYTLGIRHANKKQVMHYVGRMVPKAQELLKGKPDHIWDSVGIALCALKTKH